MTTSVKHSVSAVLSEHDELEEQFDRHQRALLTRDIAAADPNSPPFEEGRPRRSNDGTLPQEIGAAGEVKTVPQQVSDLPRHADLG